MERSKDLWMECKLVWVDCHVDKYRSERDLDGLSPNTWKSSKVALHDGLCRAILNNRVGLLAMRMQLGCRGVGMRLHESL